MGSLLNEIQQKLKVPKSQYNSFSKFYYRNAEDILEAVKPLLGEKGTLIVEDEVVQIGNRYYVKARAELSDAGSVLADCTGWAREEETKKGMDGAQITGAASSYARKYALNGLFCIDDTKDADTEEAKDVPVASKTAPKTNDREKAAKDRIMACLKLLGRVPKSKEEANQAVFDLVSLELVPEKYEEIGEALGKLVDSTDPTK